MTDDEKQKEGWAAQINEDWMIEMNIIQPALLQRIRIVLMVVYPIKEVEVTCEPSKFIMRYDIKYKFWGSLFKKKKLTREIHTRLADKFKNYAVTVNCI